MIIYTYSKGRKHTTSDTDGLIIRSLRQYGIQKGIKLPEDIKIFRTPQGKPYIGAEGIHIGVTHTKDIVIIVIASVNVGVDAEGKNRIINNAEKIVNRYFSKQEKEYLYLAEDGSIRNQRFLEIWVKKESYIKYEGGGIYNLGTTNTYSLDGEYNRIDINGYIVYVYSSAAEALEEIVNAEN